MFKVTAPKRLQYNSFVDRITVLCLLKLRENCDSGLTRPPEILTDKKIVKNTVYYLISNAQSPHSLQENGIVAMNC